MKSVHIVGATATAGGRIAFDLSLNSSQGGTGQISESGVGRFRMIVVDREVYVTGNNALLGHLGGVATVQIFHARWLKEPAASQPGLARLADAQKLFSKLLSGHGALVKGATSTIDGQKVIALHDTTKGRTLYVATTGRPYPVEVVSPGLSQAIFDRYNQSVSVSAPADAIDITKIPGGA